MCIRDSFGYVSDKVANWIELDKTGWSVELEPPLRNGNLLIDGKGGSTENSVYRSADWWFVVDMKSEKTMTGFGIDYYINGTPSSPQKVTISTSMDNETWVTQGAVDTPQSANHYFQFFVPQNARYVKVELKGLYNRYLDVTEVYVYNAQ